jgi:mono/diheme cytochrome c family protein
MRAILIAGAAVAILSGVAAAQNGNAQNGKRLFVKNGCYECHGYEGQGTSAGAHLAPRPLSAKALIAYVRHPKGTMPPYSAKVISNAELTDIRAYLASVKAPPPLKEIPLLNQ